MNNMNKQCFALASWQPDSSNSFQHSTQTSNLSGLTKWSYLISFISHDISWQPRQRDTKTKAPSSKMPDSGKASTASKGWSASPPKTWRLCGYVISSPKQSQHLSWYLATKRQWINTTRLLPNSPQHPQLHNGSSTTSDLWFSDCLLHYWSMDLHTWLLMPFLNSQFGS